MESTQRRLARFGLFEVDLETGELRREGRLIAIQEQPFSVLAALLESPDHHASREQLRQRLWPDREFLDFETGINTAVAKLRQALGDSADNPRFVVTRPRRGYRFIAPVEWVEIPAPTSDPTKRRVRRWLPSAVAALVAMVVVVVLFSRGRNSASIGASALDVYGPPGETPTGSFALAPDGRSLAFVTAGVTPADSRLWLRRLDGGAPRVLAGTVGAAMPFWSPDGRSIAFFAQGKLKRLELEGGVVSSIADAPRGRGGCWSRDGLILFAPDVGSPIFSVPALGGDPVAVTDLEDAPSHRFPAFLPDGRHFVFLVLREDRDASEIRWGRIDRGASGRIVAATSNAVYSDAGYLLFARAGSLLAQPLDPARPEAAGQPVVVSERVGMYGEDGPTGLAAFSVAHETLAVADHVRPPTRLSWFDRGGRELEAVSPPGEHMSVDVSPDARRVALTRFDPRRRASDIYTIDLSSGVVTQVTDDPWPDSGPVWDRRGERLAFSSLRGGRWRIVVRDVRNGRSELQVGTEPYVYSWTPDDAALLIGSTSAASAIDLWRLPIARGGSASLLAGGPGNQTDGEMSLDGRWLAYTSDATGRREIYLRDLLSGSSRRVSSNGGEASHWRRDGRELFYLSGRSLMAAPVRAGPSFDAGPAVRLFEVPVRVNTSLGELGAATTFGVAPDGGRFLFPVPKEPDARDAIRIVRHWTAAPHG